MRSRSICLRRLPGGRTLSANAHRFTGLGVCQVRVKASDYTWGLILLLKVSEGITSNIEHLAPDNEVGQAPWEPQLQRFYACVRCLLHQQRQSESYWPAFSLHQRSVK
jgi:hypothetical protein